MILHHFAIGFRKSVVPSSQTRTYEEILQELPKLERSRLPQESSQFIEHIASKINSIESA